MIKHICLVFLFTVFCIACKQQQQEAVDFFIDVKTITEYDSIYSDKNDEVVGIMVMYKYNNILIAYNRKTDYFFSFYDIEKGAYLGSWGSRGQGPDEFTNIGGFSIVDSLLVFTDVGKKEIIYAPIEHILNKKENIIIKKESYPHTTDFMPLFSIEIINDKKIALGAFKESRFGVLDAENNVIDNSSDYPFHYEEINGMYRGISFQSKIKSNSKQSKFVISTNQSDIFEIYQITDTGIDRIYLNHFNHIPKIMPTPGRNSGYDIDRKNNIGGLVNMAVTDDLIYFIYTSKSAAETASSGNLLNEILCYNWNGEKVRKYILPFPISAISLCVDNEYIYGIRDYEDETVIYRFKM